MKKRLFTVLLAVVTALLVLTLSGCTRYQSHYTAGTLVQTKTMKSASMSFSSFEGTMVFKLKCESEDEKINYSAKLSDGTAKVYYDCDGTKIQLFSVNSGENISDIGGELQEGMVYIIVEMPSSCKDGSFSFEIK